MSDFLRDKEGFRYEFAGVKTNSQPNNLPPSKFPYAQNIRTLGGGSLRVRPGQSSRFSTGGNSITDLRAYSTLNTDNKPRILARDSSDAIWLDNGASVGSLAAGGLGASLIPFRPNQSPQSWMYIANASDYQKFSAPDASNVVTQRKVGISEPQTPPDACPDTRNVFKLANSDNAGSWTNTLVAGAPAAVARGSADTAVAFFPDPASVPPIVTPRYSMQVGSSQYQLGEFINVAINGGGSAPMTVDDVFPAISPQSTVTIVSILYYSGTTGRCVIQSSQIPEDTLSAQGMESGGLSTSIGSTTGQQSLAALRHGSLITLNAGGGNAETVFVLSVTFGPTGATAIECVTVNSHAAGEVIKGVNALSITTSVSTASLVGQAITSTAIQSAISGAGTGTLTLVIAAANNPFTHQGIPVLNFLPTPQQDDYVHISLNISDLTKITDIQIQFDVGDGSFTQNYFYYDVQPNALQQAVSGAQTQLAASQVALQQAQIRAGLSLPSPRLIDGGVDFERGPQASDFADTGNINPSTITTLGTSQWSEILFSIVSMTRVGGDTTKTLANCSAIRVQITATAAFTFQLGSIWVGAGGQPDVGDVGALYLYRVRPRDSRTGVRGNPSPATRYGSGPRRQWVVLTLPSAAYDPQIDTWDIFRFGGSVTSWRYVGSAPSASVTFVDNTFDDAAQAGEALEFDNFEPWPSVDLQFNGTANQVAGTLALVTVPLASGCQPLSWLPGTLVQLGGNLAYTLRLRPVSLGSNVFRLEFLECASTSATVSVSVPEPLLARQAQARLFGPDASGRMLGVGDTLRPGTLSYSKPNNPDSAPDTYNREIVPPSEPLVNGIIVDGRAWVASPERWWELIPQQSDNPSEFYNPVQSPLPRGLAATFGISTDGAQKYWWAKDGIVSDAGSLTDEDLYNLFPHEGVPGNVVTYAGFSIQPPDYSRSGTFRLACSNGFLYATYQDSSGTYRVLTCDLKHGNAWTPDVYSPAVSAFYHPEQQAGTVLTSSALYDETLIATMDGRVAAQSPNSNDLGGAIVCVACGFEFDGGDARAPKQWGDFFLDLTPSATAGVSVQLLSNGAGILAAQVIPSSTSRQRVPLSVGGVVVSDFAGLKAQWTEDFTLQSVPTTLNLWQPSFDIQPARILAVQTFGGSFGVSGFGHIPWMEIAYVSTAQVTIQVTCVDGTSPSAITLPSTGGAYSRVMVRPTFNKGRLYAFQASSASSFQIFEDDSIIMFGAWGREGAYTMERTLGVPNVAQAPV